MIRLFALALALAYATPTRAAKVSDDCLRTKIWDSYGDGWQVRASTSTEIAFGYTHFYRVSLLKGRTYRVITCAGENVTNLDVLLYDHEGRVVLRDESEDREPNVIYKPERTGVHYVLLYVRNAVAKTELEDVSVAIIHQ